MRWFVTNITWPRPDRVFAELEYRPNAFERLGGVVSTSDRLFGMFDHGVLRWYYAETGAQCETDSRGCWAGPAAIANDAAWSTIRQRKNPHILAAISEAGLTVVDIQAPVLER